MGTHLFRRKLATFCCFFCLFLFAAEMQMVNVISQDIYFANILDKLFAKLIYHSKE